jgi:hypothetical protein
MMNINQKNQHKRDALIEFEPGAHKYTCAGEGDYTSVTTWLHSHFKAFDADAIIEKMMSNPVRWAKSPYYGQSRAEIKAGWDKGRDEAAAAGTAMHKKIEDYYLGLTPLEETSGHFQKFVQDFPDLTPYRTEWMIFDEDVKLAGSIDLTGGCAPRTPLLGEDAPTNPLLGEDAPTNPPLVDTPRSSEHSLSINFTPDGGPVGVTPCGGVRGGTAPLYLYDWKRCKEIKKKNDFGEWALPECINHLPDTNFWHYALQLNIYKAILERKYDQPIEGMYLVILHPNQASYQRLEVPDLSDEITELFKLRQQQLKNNVL